MGQTQYSQKKQERKWAVHPIWRGIGFVWMILIPIMSYAAAWEFVRANFQYKWLPLTPTLASPIVIPGMMVNQTYLNLQLLISWLPGQPLYYADIIFFIGFLFLGFGITSILYSFLYRAFGPPKDPYEAIEVRRSPRNRRR